MKNGRITIIFLVLLCCSLVLTGCKDTVEENTAAEAIEVKAAAEATAVAEKAVAEAEKAQVVVTKTNLVVLHNTKINPETSHTAVNINKDYVVIVCLNRTVSNFNQKRNLLVSCHTVRYILARVSN